jgi:SAM-dependent methyltransferase
MIKALNSSVKRAIPLRVRRLLSRWATRSTRWPPVGAVRLGSLDRVSPISSDWGFDRGLPIDRYYIERFLEEEAEWIRGRVLEIDTNDYTVQFGGDRVAKSDVLHIAEMKPGVTLVGDLTSADHLPSDAFDCVILTQTLQLIYDVRAALTTVHRILKPGGAALVTVPSLSKMTRDPDGKWGYFWGFTALSADRLFRECFPRGEINVRGWGNVLAATAFLHGLAAEELDDDRLRHRDPDFDVLVTIRAVKRNGSE